MLKFRKLEYKEGQEVEVASVQCHQMVEARDGRSKSVTSAAKIDVS